MALKMAYTIFFLIQFLQHSKMADVQTSEVDENLAPFNVGHEILYADRSWMRPGRYPDHTHSRLVSRLRMSRAIPPLPPAPSWRVVGQL
jgi:hypothetical protein